MSGGLMSGGRMSGGRLSGGLMSAHRDSPRHCCCDSHLCRAWVWGPTPCLAVLQSPPRHTPLSRLPCPAACSRRHTRTDTRSRIGTAEDRRCGGHGAGQVGHCMAGLEITRHQRVTNMSLKHHCVTNVSPTCHQRVTNVSLKHHWCITTVSLMCHWCVTGVLPMSHQSGTNVSLLIYHHRKIQN